MSESAVRSRIRNGTLILTNCLSPFCKAEEELVQVCIQMGKNCQPSNVSKVVVIMNNLMTKVHIWDILVEFQLKQ